VAIRGNNDTVKLAGRTLSSEHDLAQDSFGDMPQVKFNFESESHKNPLDLRSLFYIYGFATLRTIALKGRFCKCKKEFANLTVV
jgi:hypothetical protein